MPRGAKEERRNPAHRSAGHRLQREAGVIQVNEPSMGALCFSEVASCPRLKDVEEGVVGMTSNMVRWGGLAGVAAGVMFLLSGILTLITPPQRGLGSFGGYLIEVIIVVAFAFTLVTIASLHAA